MGIRGIGLKQAKDLVEMFSIQVEGGIGFPLFEILNDTYGYYPDRVQRHLADLKYEVERAVNVATTLEMLRK